MGRMRKLEPSAEPAWTARQVEVLDLLARGRTNPEIAESLGIGLDGAKWHVREVLTKLGVATREEAADYWRARSGRWGALRRMTRAILGLPLFLNWKLVAPAVLAAGAAGGVGIYLLANDSGDVPGDDSDETPAEQHTPVVISPAPIFDTPISHAFGRGDTIDSTDGIVFLEPKTGGGTFWQLPVGTTGFVSPDGRWVAWHERLYANGQSMPDQFGPSHILDTDSGADRTTIDGQRKLAVVGWSPDGTQYVAIEPLGAWARLFETATGARIRELAPSVSPALRLRFSNIEWSPDGEHLAFVRCGPGEPGGANLHIDDRSFPVQVCFSPWINWVARWQSHGRLGWCRQRV